MAERWKLLSELPGSGGYLPLRTRRYQLPDGGHAGWDIFGEERSVAVLAITVDEQIVLARQYRPGPDMVLDELPGGNVEPNEDVAAAAARELLEETGYAGQVEVVGTTWLASSCCTQRYVAVARDARKVADHANEPGEFAPWFSTVCPASGTTSGRDN